MCPIELIVRIKKDVSQALAVSVSIAGTPLGWQLSRARQNNSSFHSKFLSGLSSPPSCGDGHDLIKIGAVRQSPPRRRWSHGSSYDPRSGGVSVSLKHLPLGVFWDIPQQTPQSLGINP